MLDTGLYKKTVNQWSIVSCGKDYLAQEKAGRRKRERQKKKEFNRDHDSYTRLKLRRKWENLLFLLLK